MAPQLLRCINSHAPIRIADCGGWTDTWFARHGKVFNIAVSPFAEVRIEVFPAGVLPSHVVLHAENYGDLYELKDRPGTWQKHPLLEASIEFMHVPEQFSLRISVRSDAPVGASTGTSAAVTVALIGALDRLGSGKMSPHEIAYAAHHVEMDILGYQCGIQDQLCSAYGGINFIEMQEFPRATVSQIHIPDDVRRELERRLLLIYLGRAHSSSEVHQKVIRELEGEGPESPRLNALRVAAEKSRDAICGGNFDTLGRAMIENTEAQACLHPELVSNDAQRVIEIARHHGAVGWKVNGAGGEGGSLTILCGSDPESEASMIKRIEQENPLYKNIPVNLSRHGVGAWE